MFKSALRKLFCLVSGMRYVKENSTYYGKRTTISQTEDIGFFFSRSPYKGEYSVSLFGKCFLVNKFTAFGKNVKDHDEFYDLHSKSLKVYSLKYIRALDKWYLQWGSFKREWKNPIGYYVAEEDYVLEGTTKFSWYDEKYGLVTVDVEKCLVDRRRLLPFICKKRFTLSAQIEKSHEHNFYGCYFTIPHNILSIEYLKETVKP